MDVPVEPLALSLEALEHPLRHLDRFVFLGRRRAHSGAQQVRGARFDVLHDEL
jgi:hypothetical protein